MTPDGWLRWALFVLVMTLHALSGAMASQSLLERVATTALYVYIINALAAWKDANRRGKPEGRFPMLTLVLWFSLWFGSFVTPVSQNVPQVSVGDAAADRTISGVPEVAVGDYARRKSPGRRLEDVPEVAVGD